MKKTLQFLLFLIISLVLTMTALAHSGGTDSQGGHTNHSTGEYHYHHGYSAHQHEDLDGDGVLDCPYEFVDNTEESYTSHSTNYTAGAISGESNKKQFDPSNSLPFIFGVILLSVGLMFLPVAIGSIRSRRKEKRERRKLEKDRKIERLRLEEEQKQIKQFEKEYLLSRKHKKDWF